MSFNFVDSFFSLLPLKYRLIHSLEKDIKSADYPSGINQELQKGITAIKAAKSEQEALQMAIGIYNCVNTVNIFGFKPKNPQIAKFLREQFHAILSKIPKDDLTGEFYAKLGINGVLVGPAKFEKKSPEEEGYSYAKTPLFHLQATLKKYNANLFIQDCYERQSLDNKTFTAYQELSLQSLQHIVSASVSHYETYHNCGGFNRGQKAGFFSFLRHGSHGMTVAHNFEKEFFQNATTVEDILIKIKNFLGSSARAYHYHSFTSYLADSLANYGLVTKHEKQHYKQSDLVRELERGIFSIKSPLESSNELEASSSSRL